MQTTSTHRIVRILASLWGLAMLSLLAIAASEAEADGYVPGQLIVKFKAGTQPAGVSSSLEAAGVKEVGRIADLGLRQLRVTPGQLPTALQRLRRSSRVAYVERDPIVEALATPNDYWWPSEWGPVKINAPAAWDRTTGSSSAVIAVLDSGVDFSQPDLQGAFVPGRDVVNSDSDPSDDYGHGTEVAGVAAARGDNSIGVASYCWQCSIMPVKVLGANGGGATSDVAAGITWAVDHGAKVINMSLGSTSSSSALASAVQYAHDRGAVLVAAAGNAGATTPTYPAAFPSVLGVAGTSSTDQLTGTSNYGSWVKVAAPSCNFTTGLGAWYGTFCGTSSASPVVAGLAGLAFSLNREATNAQVEQAIETSSVSTGFVQYGRVDAAATLSALDAPASGSAPANSSLPAITGIAQSGSTLSASDGSWTGAPTTYAYQWQRCDFSGGSCGAISGATGSAYVLSPADSGSTMRVTVSAANSYGTSSATSAQTTVVASAPAPTEAQTQTATFSGTISAKQASKSFVLAVGSGTTAATLTFTKAPSLTLSLIAPDGSTVGTVAGGSGLQLTKPVSPGTYRYVVSGAVKKGSASFTLAVSYPPPS
jgi:subtilisin family serine protease